MTPLITAPEVAEIVGYTSTHTFLLMRHKLEAEFGLPAPVPHLKAPLKWRRDQVLLWRARLGEPAPELPRAQPKAPNAMMAAAAQP